MTLTLQVTNDVFCEIIYLVEDTDAQERAFDPETPGESLLRGVNI